jgi:hypothetical protein
MAVRFGRTISFIVIALTLAAIALVAGIVAVAGPIGDPADGDLVPNYPRDRR